MSQCVAQYKGCSCDVWPLCFCYLFSILNIWFIGYPKTNLAHVVLISYLSKYAFEYHKHCIIVTVCVTLSWHIGESCEPTVAGTRWCLRRDVNVDDSWGTRVDSLAPLWFSDRFHGIWVSYTYILVFIESRTHAARHTLLQWHIQSRSARIWGPDCSGSTGYLTQFTDQRSINHKCEKLTASSTFVLE